MHKTYSVAATENQLALQCGKLDWSSLSGEDLSSAPWIIPGEDREPKWKYSHSTATSHLALKIVVNTI